MEINQLMDAAKNHSGVKSDTALAGKLGISQTAVWKWRNGQDLPKPEHGHELARLAGIDPAPVVLDLWEAAAKTSALQETISRLKKVWTVSSATLLVIGTQLEAAANCILCSIRGHHQRLTSMATLGTLLAGEMGA
jgi:transcriptional regulator with XRE-family HTH domain